MGGLFPSPGEETLLAQLRGRRNGLKANIQVEKLGPAFHNSALRDPSTPFDVPSAVLARLLLGRAAHVCPHQERNQAAKQLMKSMKKGVGFRGLLVNVS